MTTMFAMNAAIMCGDVMKSRTKQDLTEMDAWTALEKAASTFGTMASRTISNRYPAQMRAYNLTRQQQCVVVGAAFTQLLIQQTKVLSINDLQELIAIKSALVKNLPDVSKEENVLAQCIADRELEGVEGLMPFTLVTLSDVNYGQLVILNKAGILVSDELERIVNYAESSFANTRAFDLKSSSDLRTKVISALRQSQKKKFSLASALLCLECIFVQITTIEAMIADKNLGRFARTLGFEKEEIVKILRSNTL